MKKTVKILSLTIALLIAASSLCACNDNTIKEGNTASPSQGEADTDIFNPDAGNTNNSNNSNNSNNQGGSPQYNTGGAVAPGDNASDLGGDGTSFGEDLRENGAYDGYFEEDICEVGISCLSGSEGCYSLEDGVLRFFGITEDSAYSISGKLRGCIVIDVAQEYEFELELVGLSLVCDNANPISALNGSKVRLTAKKDSANYIYDDRAEIDPEDETLDAGAIYSEVDLEIGGKGELTVISQNNNGIHTKDDLELKNLTLTVACVDNSLKGNDSVTLTGGKYTLIATGGDGIKTSGSDISSKGNQRGSINIDGAQLEIYAACDGIDAAYDVNISGDATTISIYTDKYSNYSEEVTANTESVYYIRFSSDAYHYSVKYYNSEEDLVWVDAEYHSKVSGGRSSYYYYSLPKLANYQKMQFFVYSSDMEASQDSEYVVASEYLTPNTAYDTFALSNRNGKVSYSWTNYSSTPSGGPGGGPGGMGGGNQNKGDHSTKGIKAANGIYICAGTLNIKSYDDSIHANNDGTLENGNAPLGNINISGGNLSLYSNDDGMHADGTLSISGGSVSVANSYEGAEGSYVTISGGSLSVRASDDGINATATEGRAIEISGGRIYVYCNGDGIDSNSRTNYEGIVFSGGNTVIISDSRGNASIDSDRGYSYTGGAVVALMPSGGMSGEAINGKNFSSVATSRNISVSKGEFLNVGINGITAIVEMPCSCSGLLVVLGDTAATVETSSSSDAEFDQNRVCWK